MNFDNIPVEERRKKALESMSRGVCPVCDQKMIRNGKRTHSKTKAIVCEELLREKLQVTRSTIQRPDGKNVEVDAKFMTKEDAESGKGL